MPKINLSTNIFNEYHSFFIKLLIILLLWLLLYFIYSISSILSILFFAFFLNLLFTPFLNKLNKYKIPDWLGIIFIYLILIIFIGILFFAIMPIFVKQISTLTSQVILWTNNLKIAYETNWITWLWLPSYFNIFLNKIDFIDLLDSIKNNFSTISSFLKNGFENFFSGWIVVMFSITNAIINFLLVFIFSFFISLERKQIVEFFYKILPVKISSYIKTKEKTIVENLYFWFKWQIILWIIIFTLTLLWLLIIKIFWVNIDEYFTLALIAWLTEFIPYIWPFLALLPALAIAISLWTKATITIIVLYVIIQQLENNVVVPYVMSKELKLSPFAVLLAMTIWASLFWVLGIIIAVPVVSIIQIFIKDYIQKDHKNLTK